MEMAFSSIRVLTNVCLRRRRRPLLKQIENGMHSTRWTIRSKASAGAPCHPCTNSICARTCASMPMHTRASTCEPAKAKRVFHSRPPSRSLTSQPARLLARADRPLARPSPPAPARLLARPAHPPGPARPPVLTSARSPARPAHPGPPARPPARLLCRPPTRPPVRSQARPARLPARPPTRPAHPAGRPAAC
jgi:hypothetical protein